MGNSGNFLLLNYFVNNMFILINRQNLILKRDSSLLPLFESNEEIVGRKVQQWNCNSCKGLPWEREFNKNKARLNAVSGF